MADDAASAPTSKPPPHPTNALVDTARKVLGQVAARVPGLAGDAAQRNAWEAVCADLQRRQQWNNVVDLTVSATTRRTPRQRSAAADRARSQARS